MATSSSASTNSSTSLPVTLNTPASDWATQLSKMLASLGQYQYAWGLGQFGKAEGVTDAQIDNYMKAAGMGMGMASNLMGRYQNVFQPIMNEYIQTAGSYNSEARQRFNMGAAESTVAQADKQGMDAAERKLQSFGIDPSSGRYADLAMTNRVQDAAARAAAGTQASVNTAAIGRGMMQNAAQMGQQVPGMTVNALNSAYQGIGGAENSALGLANTGVNLTDSAAPFFNGAASANKFPPTGQVSGSSGQSGSSGGGGGGGGKGDLDPFGIDQFGRGGGNPGGGGGGGQARLPYDVTSMQNDLSHMPSYGQRFQSPAFQDAQGGDTGGVIDTSGGDTSAWGGSGDQFGGSSGDWGQEDTTNAYPPDDSYQQSGQYWGGYAAGGEVGQGVLPDNATTGGKVPPGASPSMGQQTDDVPARLNVNEFVIPRDVAEWKGQEFFQKLINDSRKARGGGGDSAPAQGKMKPAMRLAPTFQSKPAGQQGMGA